jgi:hypothetical protein
VKYKVFRYAILQRPSDSDNDRCFAAHTGALVQSTLVGTRLKDMINAYSLNRSYDYQASDATTHE